MELKQQYEINEDDCSNEELHISDFPALLKFSGIFRPSYRMGRRMGRRIPLFDKTDRSLEHDLKMKLKLIKFIFNQNN